jgi:uncharacterized membrane protein YqhA
MNVLNVFLFASRWLMIAPVISLIFGSGYFAYLTVLETIKGFTADTSQKSALYLIQAVDSSLLVAVLMIFALGLYELFISPIDVPEDHPFRRVLVIESLDDLKSKLATVIIMLLVVKFFERSQELKTSNFLDLLMLAGGVALLGMGLWLTKKQQ